MKSPPDVPRSHAPSVKRAASGLKPDAGRPRRGPPRGRSPGCRIKPPPGWMRLTPPWTRPWTTRRGAAAGACGRAVSCRRACTRYHRCGTCPSCTPGRGQCACSRRSWDDRRRMWTLTGVADASPLPPHTHEHQWHAVHRQAPSPARGVGARPALFRHGPRRFDARSDVRPP